MQSPENSTYSSPAVIAGSQAESQQRSDFQVLLHAISTCSGLAVHQLIKLNPGLVHIQGWNKNTALHKACLTGDLNIVNLLLQNGADPNKLNDFNETPVHYASKRGIPSLVHLLAKHGAHLDIVDKKKRTVMHDAAQTGSVYMMQYLSERGISFSQLDDDRQSPLHVVCKFGHLDAFKYLSRNERCDLTQADKAGDTPLHICCQEGHMHGTWQMLNCLGYKALKVKNNQGYTPVDLCRQKDTKLHKEFLKFLEHWDKQDINTPVRGPLLNWYGLFLQPTLMFLGAIILSFLLAPLEGLIFFGTAFYIAFSVSRASHRMIHPSRWGSPVHAGMFFAGISHTILVYVVKIASYLLESEKYWLIVWGSCFLVLVEMYLYRQLLFLDPGQVRSGMVEMDTGRPTTLTDLCDQGRKLDAYCVTCEFVCLDKTKHCKICDKCYYGMDHHCLFLLKCVAHKNHTRFVWFILLTVVFMVLFLLEVLLYTSVRYPDLSPQETLSHMFWNDCWVFSMSVFNLGSIVWGTVLLRAQLTIIAKGQTFYFQGSACTLTPTERLLNVMYFLQGKPPFTKDFILDAEVHTGKGSSGHSHQV